MKLKVASIVGTRPQFVKAAPVSRALADRNGVTEIIIHTGQHYDETMSRVFFEELAIPEPTYNLGVGSADHGVQTGRMLIGLEEVLEEERPDWVLVYGDTNSTLAGTLAAVKLGLPVAHVEGGMRSFDRRMPEEINRVVTDHLADLHLCVTQTAVDNLAAEGVAEGVHLVGDVMYDAVTMFVDLAHRRFNPLARLGLEPKSYVLMTCHRPENTDVGERLAAIVRAVGRVSRLKPVIAPLHPRTRAALKRFGLDFPPSVKVMESTSYLETLVLEKNAALILTDSGGVQKEAFFHGVPCVTIRDQTEWSETVELGANILAGGDEEAIVVAARQALERGPLAANAAELYGGGRAARRIADLLIASGARF